MDAKQYYATGKRSNWKLSPMRKFLIHKIIGNTPTKVLEFGCGRGESLLLMKNVGIETYGIDINADEIVWGKNNLKLDKLFIGNEKSIKNYDDNYFDISFTCGVLDHLEENDFTFTLEQLKRVSKMSVYALETNDTPAEYYDPHDYKSHGFEKLKEFPTHKETYVCWRLKC